MTVGYLAPVVKTQFKILLIPSPYHVSLQISEPLQCNKKSLYRETAFYMLIPDFLAYIS